MGSQDYKFLNPESRGGDENYSILELQSVLTKWRLKLHSSLLFDSTCVLHDWTLPWTLEMSHVATATVLATRGLPRCFGLRLCTLLFIRVAEINN